MFGDGISFSDLTQLFLAIRSKDLVLQVKIIDGEWEDLSTPTVNIMIRAITSGKITSSNDIKLRLFAKSSQKQTV